MAFEFLPETIALIPDGNRRWAHQHKMSVFNGYELGVGKFIDFSRWCMDYGINNVSVWALSPENLKRNRNEVRALFTIYKKVANDRKMLDMIHDNRARVNIIGKSSLLPKDLYKALHQLELETAHYRGRTMNLLIGYGGREDIFHAARNFANDVKKGFGATVERFKSELLSSAVPDLDLIIRTSGERRLSGFMPWQSYYSELYFSNKLWPDFTKRDLNLALLEYGKRERRFGR
ncbi:MAG: di-trans,poly-cis-decaprenylcistransferase [Candidatus Micrarchaeota archaeon]|nr:di-trans,poly-cis-decaprenylcistransferase [Candidatus Micrarchaeota archaeon]MDE1824523.1 di-trans,poly-cis-decaprenylcistransferase [Candidatus Micrarchaeota archaeon]MDE1849265.1 di-trans,poly-cis-decaprenylcistransferase [Candidatus Micrarchaeota archaeon]